MALHLSIEPLTTHSGLELVPRFDPSTYQSISHCHSHCAIGSGIGNIFEQTLLFVGIYISGGCCCVKRY